VSDPDGDSVSVQVNWGDSSDSQGLSTLASHTYTSKGIYSVVTKATDSKGAQTFRNCGIIIVSDELATTQENRSAKLKITDVDVKVDKRSDNNLDDNDEISKEAKPGSKVEFKVEVSSLFTNSEGLDIEDVEITITVKDIDDGGDLEETSGKFNLRPRRDKRTTLNFELPLNIEEGLFTVIIEAEGDDEDGNNHFDEIELELEVQKEKHDLRFQNLELSNPKAKCGQIVAINYNLINLGEEDEDGARLIISNSQLDLDFTLNDISLESGTYDNELTGSHTFRIDNDLSPGVYPVNVKTYSDDGRLQSSKDLNLEFFGCDSKEVKIVKQNEAPALNIKQVPITTTFITTEETVAESTVPIEKFAFSVNNRIIWLLLIATLIISIVFVIASMFMLARDDF
jgi:PKD repeat protein